MTKTKHDERREHDERRADKPSAHAVHRDREWVITDRRKGRERRAGRGSSATERARRRFVIAAFLLAGLWLLLRLGVIDMPGWLPLWILHPELLIGEFT